MTMVLSWRGRPTPLEALSDGDLRHWVGTLDTESVVDILAAGTYGPEGQRIRAAALGLTDKQLRTTLLGVLRRMRDGEP